MQQDQQNRDTRRGTRVGGCVWVAAFAITVMALGQAPASAAGKEATVAAAAPASHANGKAKTTARSGKPKVSPYAVYRKQHEAAELAAQSQPMHRADRPAGQQKPRRLPQ